MRKHRRIGLVYGVGLLASCLWLVGCATRAPSGPPLYTVGTTFDSAEATRLLQEGVNTIKGSAFLRQQGGGVVTCAGSSVFLVPATYYAKKRFSALYEMKGDVGFNASRDYKFDPDPPEYYTLIKRSKCDAQGKFEFDRVADGEFFVMTQVLWTVANRQQGGTVMQQLKVHGGQEMNTVISP